MAAKTDNSEKFALHGTILEVKDAILLQDGRTILTTLGVRRFKVIEKGEEVRYKLKYQKKH